MALAEGDLDVCGSTSAPDLGVIVLAHWKRRVGDSQSLPCVRSGPTVDALSIVLQR